MKIAIFLFINIFVLTVGAILVASRYLKSRGTKQIARMLQVQDKPDEKLTAVKLLKELKASKQSDSFARLFDASAISTALEDLLQHAGLNWSVARLSKTMACLSGIGLVAGVAFPFLAGPLVTALMLALAGGLLPWIVVRKMAARRLAKIESQLPDAMAFLARSMRAGHAFTISIGMVGDDLPDPLGREFKALFNEQNLGAGLDTAFATFLRRVPLADARLFCSAALLQRKTGGNLSEILDRLSDVIRERFRLRGQVKAASAHGRMTAGILSALPVLTTVALVMVAPDYLNSMWQDPDGKKLIFVAMGAQMLGNFVIKKITRIKV